MNRRILLACLALLLLGACQPTMREMGVASGPRAWIDTPLDGARVPSGVPISITAHASLSSAARMELLVNGTAVGELSMAHRAEGLVEATGQWLPPGPGTYSLSVRALAADGTAGISEPVQLIVEGEAPQAQVELTADSTALAAGECTFLRWRVSIPQAQSIDLNGQQVPPQGEMQVCPCQTTTYDLIVLAEDKYVQSVTINVTGECGTPTSPPPQREVFFQADPSTIQAGGCTTLSWKNQDAQNTALNGQPVEWYGSQQICNLCTSQTYILEVLWPDGAQDARTLTVNVTGSCVTPTPPPTLTPTPMPTAFPQATINFWADATTIPAGTCTTIHWQTANVQAVYLNGQGVVGEGTYQACPNTTCEIYTLDVVLQDGSHDIRTLTICLTAAPPPPSATPPPQDTTPPPAPASLKPGSTDPGKSEDLGSCSPVVLRWEPVTDQGGSSLQGYVVSLQRNNNGQWQSIPPYFIIYEPSVDVTQWLGAGWDYRWNVTARDNAGNYSAPSVWRYFSCPLQ